MFTNAVLVVTIKYMRLSVRLSNHSSSLYLLPMYSPPCCPCGNNLKHCFFLNDYWNSARFILMEYKQQYAKCSEYIIIVNSEIRGSHGGQYGHYCLLRCERRIVWLAVTNVSEELLLFRVENCRIDIRHTDKKKEMVRGHRRSSKNKMESFKGSS
jgi:hypothetical protein